MNRSREEIIEILNKMGIELDSDVNKNNKPHSGSYAQLSDFERITFDNQY